MATVIDGENQRVSGLEAFCRTFLGFGPPTAARWFIEYGTHYARMTPHYLYDVRFDDTDYRISRDRQDEQALSLITLWEQKGRPASLNLNDYRNHIELPARPLRRGSKLARVSELNNILDDMPLSYSDLQRTATDVGTSARPNVFLAELNPVPRGSFYRIRSQYAEAPWRTHGFQRTARALLLQEAIRKYRPTLVVMYGWTGQRYWNKIAGCDLRPARMRSRRFDVAVEVQQSTVYAAIPAPSQFWFPEASFEDLLGQVRATGLLRAERGSRVR